MMPIKCDVKCDNIVKDNLIDLTSKNHILIKEKITPIENIQNNNNIKYNVIGPSSKNIPRHVFNEKETNMGCEFPNKDVFKPFNENNRNEEHLSNCVQLTNKNPTSTKKKKKKPLTKRMMTKILLHIRKILKTLLNMQVIIVKCFTFQIRLVSKLYFNNLPNDFLNENKKPYIYM
jgi:hypothetical protein